LLLKEEQNTNMEHWWNDTDTGNQSTWRNTYRGTILSNINRLVGGSGMEPRPSRSERGKQPRGPWHGTLTL
jgi:hypothetical protein